VCRPQNNRVIRVTNNMAPTPSPRPDSLPVPQALDPEIEAKVQEFTTACDGGRGPPVACHSLAQFQSVVMQDFKYARELYEGACFIKGNFGGKGGEQMLQGTRKIEGDKKFPYSYPNSCFNLGKIFLGGMENAMGEETNRPDNYEFRDSYVENLFTRACEGSEGEHFPSCHHLGVMLLKGGGEKGKGGKTAAIHSDTGSNGDSDNQPRNNLHGLTPEQVDTFSIKKDLPRAIKILSRNCTQEKYAPSCSLLGEMLLTPTPDVEEVIEGRTPAKAVNFLDIACDANDGKSCYNLAVLFKRGDKGVPPDQEKFKKYATKANEIIEAERRKMEISG